MTSQPPLITYQPLRVRPHPPVAVSGQAVDNAQAAVASAQAIVDAVAEVQSSDVINMSVAYIALKNYLANPSSANAAALQEVAKGADYVKELQQKFKSDASLDVVVDPSDPTVQEACPFTRLI